MPAHTNTPPPNGRFSTMFVWWNLVPCSLQIIVWRESLFKLNLDSSVNSMFLHSFKVQCWRCWLHCKWDRMCTRVRVGHTLLDVWHRDRLPWVSSVQIASKLKRLRHLQARKAVILQTFSAVVVLLWSNISPVAAFWPMGTMYRHPMNSSCFLKQSPKPGNDTLWHIEGLRDCGLCLTCFKISEYSTLKNRVQLASLWHVGADLKTLWEETTLCSQWENNTEWAVH